MCCDQSPQRQKQMSDDQQRYNTACQTMPRERHMADRIMTAPHSLVKRNECSPQSHKQEMTFHLPSMYLNYYNYKMPDRERHSENRI